MIKIASKLPQFKLLMNIIKDVNTETDFIFSANELLVKVINSSSTSIVSVVLNKSGFEIYQVEEEQIFTLNTELVCKILSKFDKEVCIDFEDECIKFYNGRKEYMLNYFVGKKDERPLPTIDYQSKWIVKSQELIDKLKRMSDFGYLCCLEYKEGRFLIKIKSDIVKGQEEFTNCNKIESRDVAGWYDLSYFECLFGLSDIFEEVKLGFGDEQPCIIKNKNSWLDFCWLLAPRVREDE